MKSIGTIIKEIIIPHSRGNIRLNPEFVVFEAAYTRGLLLGTDYQRMYKIGIHNSINRHVTIGTNKENKFQLDIYQLPHQETLEKLLNKSREAQFTFNLISEHKISSLKALRKNRQAFYIGEEPLETLEARI
ncbi:hypothetical protein O181_053528 [Austropuccinia psidii MF-1]|uniref:Uncharacterized protein n=1 Tax=Austropuccinia psidii MF-1 TaxID=1389203 RepID=A0A9Q3E4J2_9BASI|nr:hypothetical protein [Austropuccinia psidii MF-1]